MTKKLHFYIGKPWKTQQKLSELYSTAVCERGIKLRINEQVFLPFYYSISSHLVIEDNQWRIRTNVELEKILDVNIGSSTKRQCLIYRGRLMQETPRKYTDTENDLGETQSCVERWCREWDKMGIVNCRQIEQERDGWRRATREALILLG